MHDLLMLLGGFMIGIVFYHWFIADLEDSPKAGNGDHNV